MSKGTIQDKLSGKSMPKMAQVLALVQAFADHAQSIGAPLATSEISEKVWRDRVIASEKPPVETITVYTSEGISEAAQDEKVRSATKDAAGHSWNLEPLLLAGMSDVVALIKSSRGRPISDWLPEVVEEIHLANMTDRQFLRAAATEEPTEAVKVLLSLDERSEDLAERYWRLCLRHQPPPKIPALLTALRRHGSTETLPYSEGFVDSILARNTWAETSRKDLADVVKALRSASLDKDAEQLLAGIGKYTWGTTLVAVATCFPDELLGDRDKVLMNVASGGIEHLVGAINAVRDLRLDGTDTAKIIDRMLFGIPYKKNKEVAEKLESRGFENEARRALELEGEVPF
ncbi:hypothetical protein ABVG11_19280 [Streptomyces sp. HD1123-B1]|uniref:hypothetical protein n=1 Tax=Streptomyces huangiella TaxID=3228804 RepID=UPI003D7DA0EA